MIGILHIQNVGIIDDITIDFGEGLNILTGETGAGKTLIMDSLQMISRRKIFKGDDEKRARLFFSRGIFLFTRERRNNQSEYGCI